MVFILLSIMLALLICVVILWAAFKRAQNLTEPFGFEYDYAQDIFYSADDAWQKEFGYSRLYDEAAPVFDMILDCEPFYFDYDGRRWLIELWKGQYGVAAGCEIGIYYRDDEQARPDEFFKCAEQPDWLEMALCLYKDRAPLFQRYGVTWWLTGFKPGEFSEPGELIMTARLTMKDEVMLAAFTEAVRQAGYTEQELAVEGLQINITFERPHTPAPVNLNLCQCAQKRNKRRCAMYQRLTADVKTAPEKLALLKERNPFLYGAAQKMGRTKSFYQRYGQEGDSVDY